jgi:predicted HAD superfamily Cof-like phosphohydrolase
MNKRDLDNYITGHYGEDQLKETSTSIEFFDVLTFHSKFGLLINSEPTHLKQCKLNERIEFLQEELDEFKKACAEQDLEGQADALVDLVYVAIGTAVMMGLPWDELWADVQRANMAKVRGVTHRGHKVDCTKPPGWVGPQTGWLLEQAGYNRTRFMGPVGNMIIDERCDDDF